MSAPALFDREKGFEVTDTRRYLPFMRGRKERIKGMKN
jgi:hypothetical protein